MKRPGTAFLFMFCFVVLQSHAAAAGCTPPACTKIVDNGPDAGKKILVVLGDGYADADQSKYNSDVDNLVTNGVFGNDFFRENQNAFNIYRINLISVDSGVSQRIYNENGTWNDASDDTIVSTTMKNTALEYIWSGSWAHCWLEASAQTGGLLQAALATYVPNRDFIVVILNQNSYGGCGGGGMQVVPSGVTWHVMAHEFGHGVGGLMDEYTVGGTWTGGTINYRNCSSVLDRSGVFWNRFISPTTPVPTTFTGGMDPAKSVGEFEGCLYRNYGIYRPVLNCRMRGNTPEYCPVCYTLMKKALYPFVNHNFADAVSGDFNGDGHTDVLIHNDDDLSIYRTRTSSHEMDLAWIANNIVPGAPGAPTWQPAAHDRYYVGDFDGDSKDDVFVFNGSDWSTPHLGLLHSTGSGLQCVARYDGFIPGFWAFRANDKFFVGDFDGDGKADLYVFNGDAWAVPYLGMLKSSGNGLSGVERYDGHWDRIHGWALGRDDQFFVGDFNGDHRADLYAYHRHHHGSGTLGMLRSSGTELAGVKAYKKIGHHWHIGRNDEFYVGDFDGDNKDDLYVFRREQSRRVSLLMAKSTGYGLRDVRVYDNSYAHQLPGWTLGNGDKFYVSDANNDGKADLFVYNSSVPSKERLGALTSLGSSLNGIYNVDAIGFWNLGQADKIIPANYEGAAGKADVFIRNNESFGLMRFTPNGFVLDRIYYHWIYTPIFDSKPWSDSMP